MTENGQEPTLEQQLKRCVDSITWFGQVWDNTFLEYQQNFGTLPAWQLLTIHHNRIMATEHALATGLETFRTNPNATALDTITFGAAEVAFEELTKFSNSIVALKIEADRAAQGMGKHRGTTYEQDVANWLCQDLRETIWDQAAKPMDELCHYRPRL